MSNELESVLNKMKKSNYLNINDNDYVIAGISGGADSMCLLHLLLRLRNIKKFNIVVAHVHHNVRKESDDELIYVRNYCIKNDIIFESIKLEKNIVGNFESIARQKRYDFFNSLIIKYHAKYLLTAHHGDDLMETVLMRIVRGSNLKGYSGFQEITDNGTYQLVRPLISVTKSQIKEYDIANNIEWAEDYTNKDDSHTRNRYRKYILPVLKQEDVNVNLKFLKYSETLQECSNYIDKQVESVLIKCYVNNVLDITKFNQSEDYIKKCCIYSILYQYYKSDISYINDKNVTAILSLLASPKPNSYIYLPHNVKGIKDYNNFYLDEIKMSDNYNFKINGCVQLPNNMVITEEDSSDWTNNFICRLDSAEVKTPLFVRTKLAGDYIYIKNLNGKKKIKDIFIDQKISLNDRNIWPVVVDSNNIVVWLPGLRKSKYDKQKQEKYDIILKYQQGGKNNE